MSVKTLMKSGLGLCCFDWLLSV